MPQGYFSDEDEDAQSDFEDDAKSQASSDDSEEEIAAALSDWDPDTRQYQQLRMEYSLDKQEDYANRLKEILFDDNGSSSEAIRLIRKLDENHLGEIYQSSNYILYVLAQRGDLALFKIIFKFVSQKPSFSLKIFPLKAAMQNSHWDICNFIREELLFSANPEVIYDLIASESFEDILLNLLTDNQDDLFEWIVSYAVDEDDAADEVFNILNKHQKFSAIHQLVIAATPEQLERWKEDFLETMSLVRENPESISAIDLAYASTILFSYEEIALAEEISTFVFLSASLDPLSGFLAAYIQVKIAIQIEAENIASLLENMGRHYQKLPIMLQRVYADNIEECVSAIDLSTSEKRKALSNALTVSGPTKQEGRTPKISPQCVLRPPRSYGNQRREQLLRQIATQIYFALLGNKGSQDKLVEVQCMHLMYQSRSSLFIAINHIGIAKKLFTDNTQQVISRQTLETWLTTPRDVTRDSEGTRRSSRYAGKIRTRVFDEKITAQNSNPLNLAQAIALVLKYGNVIALELNNIGFSANSILLSSSARVNLQTALANWGNIYIIMGSCAKHPGRHAEEFLMDVYQFAKTIMSLVSLQASVGGKRRPCDGCTGRMLYAGPQFSSHPGKFWLNTIETQSESAAQRTICTLLTRPSYVTVDNNGKVLPDYDSASDSDDEKAAFSF